MRAKILDNLLLFKLDSVLIFVIFFGFAKFSDAVENFEPKSQYCSLCKQFVTENKMKLSETKFWNLEAIIPCRDTTYSESRIVCVRLLNHYIPNIIYILSEEFQPDALCDNSSLCRESNTPSVQFSSVEPLFMLVKPDRISSCIYCKTLILQIRNTLHSIKYGNDTNYRNMLQQICDEFASDEFKFVCNTVLMENRVEFVDRINQNLVNLSSACADKEICLKNEKFEEVNYENESWACSSCRSLAIQIGNGFSSPAHATIYANLICLKLGDENSTCIKVFEKLCSSMFPIISREFKFNDPCSSSILCGGELLDYYCLKAPTNMMIDPNDFLHNITNVHEYEVTSRSLFSNILNLLKSRELSINLFSYYHCEKQRDNIQFWMCIILFLERGPDMINEILEKKQEQLLNAARWHNGVGILDKIIFFTLIVYSF